MVTKTIAPYGKWESQLSITDVTAGSRSLSSPRVCPSTGRAFFIEARGDGTNAIIEVKKDGPVSVLPKPHSSSTIVYEYGGLSYTILPGAPLRILFSDAKERSVKILAVDTGAVDYVLQPSETLRYGDFDPHPLLSNGDEKHAWVLANQEDHTNPTPSEVQNYVVAINIVTKEVKRVVQGADFYMYPRFSPNGERVSWLEWYHPDLPFLNVKLFWADWDPTGAVTGTELVAGEQGKTVAEPRWSPSGALFFGQEITNFRQLFSRSVSEAETKEVVAQGTEEAEFGSISWVVGCQSYVFLTPEKIVAATTTYGASQLVHIDLTTGISTRLDVPSANLRGDVLARLSSTSVLVVGSGTLNPVAVFRVDIADDLSATATVIRESTDKTHPQSIFSQPEHIRVAGHKGFEREIHGFFWPPHNPKFAGPDGELPPLIVNPHGGPTGHTPPGLSLNPVQFYTSRGYAYFAINYTGSTGHGKKYREALYGRWGIVDTDDVAECVDHLVKTGRADGKRVGIEGGSAGGYNVLQSLCWYPDVFASGICFCGVSDIVALTVGTHKMESRYMDVLMDVVGKSQEEKDKLFVERSPLNFVQQIRAPLLLIHGEADPVVPIEQSREVKRKIEERGGEVKLVAVPGEGHGFKKAVNLELYLREAESWWAKTML